MILPLAEPTIGHLLDDARRDRLPRELVVHGHGDPRLRTRVDDVSDVRFEGRVPTLVRHDERVAHPHAGPMRCRIETEDHPPPLPTPGNEQRPLVPDVTHVVVHGGIDEHVVVAAGDGHRDRVNQGCPPPALIASDAADVDGEFPQAVEPLGLSCRIVLGTEHRIPFVVRWLGGVHSVVVRAGDSSRHRRHVLMIRVDQEDDYRHFETLKARRASS